MSAQERFQALRMSARQIISNKLTMGFIAVSVAYWIAAPFLPTEWRDVVLLTMRAAITAGLALTAATYFEAATRSLLRGDDGSVAQWLSGVVIFCTAMASSSVYSMAWIWAGRPEWMTNHPVLGFILLWQVVGVSLLIKAPDADRPGISLYKARWLIALAFFAAILVAFTAGRVTSKETSFSQVLQPLHPQCATDQPFWGNITSRGARIYHGPDSPYRSMVAPEQCFRTEAEARAAGFRAPG